MRHRYDATGQLKDAGLVGASAAGTVGGVAKIYDAGQGRLDAVAVIDVTAMEIGTGDELYEVIIQGSTDSGFATGIVNLATLKLGHVSTFHGGATVQPLTGRYELQVWNEVNGVLYRYLREYTYVAGTIATGVNHSCFLATDDI